MKNVAVFGAGRIGRIHAANLAALRGVARPDEGGEAGRKEQEERQPDRGPTVSLTLTLSLSVSLYPIRVRRRE